MKLLRERARHFFEKVSIKIAKLIMCIYYLSFPFFFFFWVTPTALLKDEESRALLLPTTWQQRSQPGAPGCSAADRVWPNMRVIYSCFPSQGGSHTRWVFTFKSRRIFSNLFLSTCMCAILNWNNQNKQQLKINQRRTVQFILGRKATTLKI